jgi:hypothetical protein
MHNKLAVSKLAENILKYSKVNQEKALISFIVPFELWKEIYEECAELEKDNICWAYLDGGQKKYNAPSLYFFEKYKL